jgi:hypothetical protein
VFLSDWRTGTLIDEAGQEAGDRSTAPVFDSLVEAEAYAEQLVAGKPSVCAGIYDHLGRSGDPLRQIYHSSVRARFDPARRARRYVWIGSALLCAFAVWALVGRRSNEHFLWFYLFGMKFLVLGSILFIRGLAFFIERRYS